MRETPALSLSTDAREFLLSIERRGDGMIPARPVGEERRHEEEVRERGYASVYEGAWRVTDTGTYAIAEIKKAEQRLKELNSR